MQTAGTHSAKNVYPSDRGLHLEFETHEQALAFYQDGSCRGISYDIEGVTVIKPFKVNKKPLLTSQERESQAKG
jgi:hypothetical protein